MIRIGLTGGIATGKSTIAARFAAHGIPFLGSDTVVHELYSPGGAAVAPVGKAFPSSLVDGGIDRGRLMVALEGSKPAFARLEAIVHPLVWALHRDFFLDADRLGHPLALIETPLLFETGKSGDYDVTITTLCSLEQQRSRALERPGMDDEKLAVILSRQLSHAERTALADFTINTGMDLAETMDETDRIIALLRERAAHA